MQIHYLAARGDVEGVRRQLSLGVPVDARLAHSGATPLMFASKDRRADLSMLEFLISRRANPNASDDLGYTSLGLAAKSGDLEKTRYLLEAGAGARMQGRHGYTALIHAIYAYDENLDVVDALLKADADPKAKPYSQQNETPIRVAYLFSHFNIMKMLFESGIELADAGWSKLMYAIAYGTLEDIDTQLQQDPAALFTPTSGVTIGPEVTIWHFCLSVGDLTKARFLLDKGVERAPDELLAAVSQDAPKLVGWLVETGASLEARDSLDYTPLMLASSRGRTENMRVLIDAGADVNAQDSFQQTALTFAKNAVATKVLVSAGAEMDHIDGLGYSPLKYAAENGEIEVARTLLELGADPDASSIGETPLHMAILHDQIEVAQLLLEAGVDPNSLDGDGRFPLMKVQTTDAARLLIEFGADAGMSPPYGGHTLIKHHADDPELVRFLKNHLRKHRRKSK